MGKKSIISLIIVVIALLAFGIVAKTAVGFIDAKEWVFVQPYWGEARIQNGSGMYWKGFATTFPYPRYMEFVYSDEKGEGEFEKESIRVTFNDGSTAQMSSMVVIETPNTEVDQLAFHKQMNGSPDAIKSKVKAHLTECLKTTATVMSSTEHQVSRKSDYSRKVENQLTDGIYDMKQVRKVLEDRVDEHGEPVSVPATEIIIGENGQPVIAKQSPITAKYKMTITQFSIKRTNYDPETLLQFAAKKTQFLNAETSKSEREAMVQEALKIEAEGLKDKAQAEADANVKKATAVIAAELKAEVALQTKAEADTRAEMVLSVATTNMKSAQVALDTAKLDAAAIIELAKAEQEKIRLAGALTELEQALIDAKVQMADAVSKNLAQIPVPAIIMGGGGAGGASQMENLINIKLMTDSGIMKMLGIDAKLVERSIDRTKTSK
jgi:hypothetical protein